MKSSYIDRFMDIDALRSMQKAETATQEEDKPPSKNKTKQKRRKFHIIHIRDTVGYF